VTLFDRIAGSGSFVDEKVMQKEIGLRQENAGSQLDRFAAYLEPQDQKQFTDRRLKMIQAGYRNSGAVRTFYFAQMIFALLGLLAGSVYLFLFSGNDPMHILAAKVFVPCLAGYYLPTYWIERRREIRQTELQDGFPDALDLMLICVESGQTLDHTIMRVAKEVEPAYPTLSEELTIISNETRAGKDRAQVLRDFAERASITDIKAFVTVLIQSAKFGTPIGDALRVFSSEMRDKRVMRAEEKANTLPTKMTLVTMLFTVPPLLVMLVGPSIYDIIYSSSNNIYGHLVGLVIWLLVAGLVTACEPAQPELEKQSCRLKAPLGTPKIKEAVDGLIVGHRLMAAGEYEIALKAYGRASQKHGYNADVLSAIGAANLKLGRVGQAETFLRAAVKKDDTFAAAWNNLGVILSNQGKIKEAERTFRLAFALDSGRSDEIRTNLNRAIAKLSEEQYIEPKEAEKYELLRRGNGRFLLLQTPSNP
jgi:tight adherence protein C